MDKDLISVIIVARNAERTLARTINGILSQQGVRMEIVFVDDASTDSTKAIAQTHKDRSSIPFSIIQNSTNLGITKSRNVALKAAQGAYVAVVDSDDFWTAPNKLSKQKAFLEANPACLVVGTQMRMVAPDGLLYKATSYALTDANIRQKILAFNQFCHSSILMRNVGQTYDESLYIWEDHDLFLQLGTKGTLANLDACMVDYEYVARKYSFSKKLRILRNELRILAKHRNSYPNAPLAYAKWVVKSALVLLHLK